MKRDDTGSSSTGAMIIGGGIGGVVAGALGALLWSSHRFLGFLVGAAFVGAPAGATVGYLVSASAVKGSGKRDDKELPTDGRPAPGWSQAPTHAQPMQTSGPQAPPSGSIFNQKPAKKEETMQPLNLMAMP